MQQSQQTLPARQFPKLDDGELEAIPLAQELHASFLLMDDSEGREEAKGRAIPVTGTIGILETAGIRGLIDLPPVLAQLQTTTLLWLITAFCGGAGSRRCPEVPAIQLTAVGDTSPFRHVNIAETLTPYLDISLK